MKTISTHRVNLIPFGSPLESATSRLVRLTAFAGLAVTSAFVGMPAATAASPSLPSGAQTVSGAATVKQNGSTLTVTQTSEKAVTNWQSFNIGAGKTVNFVQPSASSVSLNRVIGNDVSVIQGALNANGKVFLLNPNGVLFTASAQVNVGGIVASTLRMSTEDFLAGRYTFDGAGSGSVVNQGNITAAKGGFVGLIAAKVTNTGNIVAPEGSVLAGAGNRVTLDLGGPIKIKVEEGVLDALVEQGGAIRADGGLVYLTAKALGEVTSTVINHTGITEAKTLSAGKDGKIYLMGGMEKDRIVVGGKLDASAPNGGDGGFIETSAAKVKINDDVQVTTAAPKGKTGTWLIDPINFSINFGDGESTDSSIGATTLSANLASSSVTIQTSASEGEGAGYIVLNAPVTRSSGEGTTTLTLAADEDVVVLADISGSLNHPLNIVLAARARGGVNGMVYLGATSDGFDTTGLSLTTFGGNITIGGGDTAASSYAKGHVLWEDMRGGKWFNNYSPIGVRLYGVRLDATGSSVSWESYSSSPSGATTGGNIVIRAEGGTAESEMAPRAEGLSMLSSLLVTGGAGTVTLDVKGGSGIDSSAGLYIDFGSSINTNQGLISIKATAGDGFKRYGISNANSLYGSFNVATNGSVLFEGDAIMMKYLTGDGSDFGLVLSVGGASHIKAPLVGLLEERAGVKKMGVGALTLWGDAQAWSAPSTEATSTNGTFYNDSETKIRLHGITAAKAFYAFDEESWPFTQADQTAVYLRLNTGLSSVYGNTPAFTYSLYDASTEGNVISSELASPSGTAVWTGSTIVPTASSGRGGYLLTYASGITLGNSSYLLNPGDAVLYTVTPRPVTVTPAAKSKVYGNVDPELTYAITSGNLIGSDQLTGTLTRGAGNTVGSYVISPEGFTGEEINTNYAVTTATGLLTITPRPVTVTPAAKSKVYGNVDPELTYAITSGNLIGSDQLTGTLTRGAGNTVGSYVISPEGFNNEENWNYAVTTATGLLTITPRPVTVTPDAKTKVSGAADPELTYAITSGNLVADDKLMGTLSRAAGNSVGNYVISPEGFNNEENWNYSVTTATGLLTITAPVISTEVKSTLNSVYVVPPVVSRPVSAQLSLGLQLVDVAPAARSQSNDNAGAGSSAFAFDPVAAAKRAPGTVLVLTGGVKRAPEDTDERSKVSSKR